MFIFGPAPRGPGEGSKGQILTISTKSILKIFMPKCDIYSIVIDVKHIERDLLCDLRNALWGGTWGVGRGQKLSFSEHGHVAYQIEGNDE